METALTNNDVFNLNYFNPSHLDTVQRAAKIFIHSELVPKIYQAAKVGESKAIANSFIALDMANRLQANPLMIMQNLNIIQGKPSWSSKFLIAMINQSGKYDQLQFRFENKGKISNLSYTEYQFNQTTQRNQLINKTFAGPVDNITCVAYTKLKSGGDLLESMPVSVEMAIKEGWFTKSGSKWPTMTQQMLMYRAASYWASIFAPDISMGLKTEEENNDIIDISEHQKEHQNTPLKNIIQPENNEKTANSENQETGDFEKGQRAVNLSEMFEKA